MSHVVTPVAMSVPRYQDGDGDSVKDTVRRLAAELGVRQKAAAAIDLKVKGLRYDGHVVQRHTS